MSSSYYKNLIDQMINFKNSVLSLISNLDKCVSQIETIEDSISSNYRKNGMPADKNKAKNVHSSLNSLLGSLNGTTVPGIEQKIAELRRNYNAALAREEAERRAREEAERKAREEAEAAARENL